MAEHGTRARFNAGCTDGPDGKACAPCTKASREYFRQRNQGKKAAELGSVTALPTARSVDETGPTESGCLAVLGGLERAKARPDLAEAALALARDIDSPIAIAQRANLVARYQAVLDDLTKGSERKGRLASVRAMTSARSAG